MNQQKSSKITVKSSTGGYSKIVIEKDVPIPALKVKVKYPFSDLQPGDSFVIPKKTTSASVTVAYWKKKLREKDPKVEFTIRAIDDHTSRVWRIDGAKMTV